MPKFGFNLLLWTAKIDESCWPLFDHVKAWGYDGVELPIFDVDQQALQSAGRRLDALGLGRTSITVCTAMENPIAADRTTRRAGVERLKRVVDASATAGAQLLCGPLHSALGVLIGRGRSSDEWKWGQESLAEVGEHARQADVVVAVEFLNRFECYFLNCAADCARFVREIGHPNIRMMYDTFHAHVEEKDIVAAIQACGDQLAHVHISENDRSTPGQGTVDWRTTFRALSELGYDGWLTVEAFGLYLPELAAATRIWRKMYGSEQQLAEESFSFLKRSWSDVSVPQL